MTIYYSKTTGGFYDNAIHTPAQIPTDAVEVPPATYTSVMEAQSQGKVITADSGGNPIAVDPASLLTLAQLKAAQIASISAACQEYILSGFVSSALGSAYTYPSTFTDQQNLASSVLASLMPGLASGWTTEFWCKSSTGVWAFLPHTAAEIQQVGQDGKAAILAAMNKNQTLAGQVNAATTASAVTAIVWSAP